MRPSGQSLIAVGYYRQFNRILVLRLRGVPFEAQKPLPIQYKGDELSLKYVPDLICFGKIIVEIKAMKDIYPEHKAQLLNYLKATGLRVGMLVNFGGHPKVQIVKMING